MKNRSLLKKLEQIQFTEMNYGIFYKQFRDWEGVGTKTYKGDYEIYVKENVFNRLNKTEQNKRQKIEEELKKLGKDPVSKAKPLGSLYSGVGFFEKKTRKLKTHFSVITATVFVCKIKTNDETKRISKRKQLKKLRRKK